MDFGTIKARLEAGMYTVNAEGFTTDMRQVFTNAFIYNAPGSDVNSMAMTLQARFTLVFEIIQSLKGRPSVLAETCLSVIGRHPNTLDCCWFVC